MTTARMGRRLFVAAMAAAPLLAQALPPKRVVVIAEGPRWNVEKAKLGFGRNFAEHGLVDGRHIEIVIVLPPPAEQAPKDRMEACRLVARRAMDQKPDVVMAHMDGFTAESCVVPITRSIPLVLMGGGGIDEVNRRGLEVTGFQYSFNDLVPKRMEVLKGLRPRIARIALVVPGVAPLDPATQERQRVADSAMAEAARKVGLELVLVEVSPKAEPGEIVDAVRRSGSHAAEIASFLPWSAELAQQLAKAGFLVSGVGAQRAKDGALIGGWSVGLYENWTRIAARVVRGERASRIPVEYPTKFGMAINLKTARTLGITVPQSILLRMDEVYE